MGTPEWREKNKEKIRQYKRNHYLKNREKMIARAQEWKIENRKNFKDYIRSIKEDGQCIKCGFEHPGALVFHHRPDEIKVCEIANFRDKSFKKLKEEIEKCDLWCANCHNIHHYEQRNNKS